MKPTNNDRDKAEAGEARPLKVVYRLIREPELALRRPGYAEAHAAEQRCSPSMSRAARRP
jgi:hypothetical protein